MENVYGHASHLPKAISSALDSPDDANLPTVEDRKPTIPFFRHSRLMGEKFWGDEALKDEIQVAGLVQSIRKQKKASFAHIADGSTLEGLQAVLSPEQAEPVTNGSYVNLVGKWQQSPGKGQSHELQVKEVTVYHSNPEENPIQKKYQTAEFLRTLPHLRLRVSFHSMLTRFRSKLIAALAIHYSYYNVVQVHPPIITSSDCEGAGEVFTIAPRTALPNLVSAQAERQYFGEAKYLTVSSQLHLEAFAAGTGDVWALSPTFRAEESDTPRHLSEFYMLEVEYRGLEVEGVLMTRVESLLKSVVYNLRQQRNTAELLQYYADVRHRGDDKQIDLEARWESLNGDPKKPEWPRFRHHKVVSNLLAADSTSGGPVFKTKPSYNHGLQLEHERWIVENMGGGKPVFVTDYPKAVKPFYMLPSRKTAPTENSHADSIETVACFDLLFPFGYGEIAGGSLREHRLENLISNMRERGMLKKRDPNKPAKDSEYPFLQPDEDLGSLQWYADLRRFGTSPHGGFGLGFDRLLAYLTGVSNVRDVVPFPRAFGRIQC